MSKNLYIDASHPNETRVVLKKDNHIEDYEYESVNNTLIKNNGEHYDFFLVDLNRMKFGTIPFETRIQNFSRLTKERSLVEIMSDEYAKCIGKDYDTVFKLMWHSVESFQYKIQRKKRLKKLFKFEK